MEFKSNEAKTWLEDENGKQVAVLDHPEVRPGVVNLVHTEVDPSLGGQGIAGKITQAVADSLREKGLKAELSCSYSIKWFSLSTPVDKLPQRSIAPKKENLHEKTIYCYKSIEP